MRFRSNGAIQQEAGPYSALGRLKFEMNDRYDVYLHDTPDQVAVPVRGAHDEPRLRARRKPARPRGNAARAATGGDRQGDRRRTHQPAALPVPMPILLSIRLPTSNRMARYSSAAIHMSGMRRFGVTSTGHNSCRSPKIPLLASGKGDLPTVLFNRC